MDDMATYETTRDVPANDAVHSVSTSAKKCRDETTSSDKKKDASVPTWNLRLGHLLPVKAVNRHVKARLLPHMTCPSIDCQSRLKGKYRRRFDGSLTRSEEIWALHVDTKGMLHVSSTEGHRYFVTIVEEASRYVKVVKSNMEVSELLLRFVKFFEKQTGRVVKRMHMDGGSEFFRARDYLEDHGCDVSTSTPYTPESNSLVERMNQTVVTTLACRCLQNAKMPQTYLQYAVRHVVDCRNYVLDFQTKK